MDPAFYDESRYDMTRYGVYVSQFESIAESFESGFHADLDVTRHALSLSDTRDALTGWWPKSYSENTIQMVIGTRSVSDKLASVGSYVKEDAVGLTLDPVHVGDKIVTSDSVWFEVKAVIPHEVGDSFLRRDCDLTRLPFGALNTGSQTTTLPSGTPQDARYRTREWLETYLNADKLTEDDDTTPITFITAFGKPNYSLEKVFNEKLVELVFSIDEPTVTPLFDNEGVPYGFIEVVPIMIWCVDKTNVSGPRLMWKANQELRRVATEYPEGSKRSVEKIAENTENLGSTILYSSLFNLRYRRGLT